MNERSFISKGQNSFSQDLKVGEPFKLSITLVNSSGLLMPSSYLVLEPYQFSDELKRIVKDLTGKMVVTSSYVTKVPQVRVCVLLIVYVRTCMSPTRLMTSKPVFIFFFHFVCFSFGLTDFSYTR